MNVKVNQKIANLTEVTSVDCFPSCGDETNAIGIAFQLHALKSSSPVKNLDGFCLGPYPISEEGFDFDSISSEFDIINFNYKYKLGLKIYISLIKIFSVDNSHFLIV